METTKKLEHDMEVAAIFLCLAGLVLAVTLAVRDEKRLDAQYRGCLAPEAPTGEPINSP